MIEEIRILFVGVGAIGNELAKTSDAPTCRNHVTHEKDVTKETSGLSIKNCHGRLRKKEVLVPVTGGRQGN